MDAKNLGEKMSTNSIWVKKENGEIVFQVKDLESGKITEKTPEDVGLVKEAEFDVFFMKEVENPDEFEIKTKTFFVQHMKITVREAYNLWLKLSDRKYFLTDILNGQTLSLAFESDNNIEVTKSRPRKVSLEDVKTAMKDNEKAFYFFGRVEGSDPQNLSYGKTVSA
jgi:hypothetical protein